MKNQYNLARLFTENGIKGNCYNGPKEGMHQCRGNVYTLVAKKIAPCSGVIQFGTLSYDNFKKAGMNPMTPIAAEDDTIE